MSSTFVGAPSLGQNFGYNPFGNAPVRRRVAAQQEDLPENYGTGFSPDGQSYSVINDFGKIAAQALADYEAQINNQRRQNLSIDSRGIVTAKPVDTATSEAIYNSTIRPIQSIIGGGAPQSGYTLRTYKDDASGNIIGINPRTGEGSVVFKGTPKPEAVRKPDTFPLPTELNNLLQPSGVKMLTMPQIDALLPSLAPELQTNSTAMKYKGWLNSSNAPAIGAPPMSTSAGKVATREVASQFLQQARGDKDIARRLAREAGYSF